MDTRYKLVITISYFALAVVALAVVTLIVIFRPDATATIIQFVGTTLAVASTGAVTFYMLGKQNEKIEQVKVQTNGANSALREENAKLTAQLLSVVGNSPTASGAKYRPVPVSDESDVVVP